MKPKRLDSQSKQKSIQNLNKNSMLSKSLKKKSQKDNQEIYSNDDLKKKQQNNQIKKGYLFPTMLTNHPSKQYFSRHPGIVMGEELMNLQKKRLKSYSSNQIIRTNSNSQKYLVFKQIKQVGKNTLRRVHSLTNLGVQLFQTTSKHKNTQNNAIARTLIPNQSRTINQKQINQHKSSEKSKSLLLKNLEIRRSSSLEKLRLKSQKTENKFEKSNIDAIQGQKQIKYVGNKSNQRKLSSEVNKQKQGVINSQKSINNYLKLKQNNKKLLKLQKKSKLSQFIAAQGYIQLNEVNCSKNYLFKQIYEESKLMRAKRLSVSCYGITLYYFDVNKKYDKNQLLKYNNQSKQPESSGNEQFLSLQKFKDRVDIIKKLGKNQFFAKFILIKNFKFWKGLLKQYYELQSKKQIKFLEQCYDRDYYKSLIRYKEIIMKGYLHLYQKRQIFVINNVQSLKLPIQKYCQSIVKMLKSTVFQITKNNIMKQVFLYFIYNLRNWFNLSYYKLISSQKNLNNVKQFEHKQHSYKILKQNNLNKGLPILQFQPYQIRSRIQKEKKLLKKIIYMETEEKFDFLINLLKQIEKKIQINYRNYKHAFLAGSNQNNLSSLKQSHHDFLQKAKNSKNKTLKVKFVDNNQIQEQIFSQNAQITKNANIPSQINIAIQVSSKNNLILRQIQSILTTFMEIFMTEPEAINNTNGNQITKNDQKSNDTSKNKRKEKGRFLLRLQDHQLRFVPFIINIPVDQFKQRKQIKTSNDINTAKKQQINQNLPNPSLKRDKSDKSLKKKSKLKNVGQESQYQRKQILAQINYLIDKIVKQYSLTVREDEQYCAYHLQQFTEKSLLQTDKDLFLQLQRKMLDDYEKGQINQLLTNNYCRLQFINEMALNNQISQRQFKIINQVINSVKQYNFTNILKNHHSSIKQIRHSIFQIIMSNFNELKLIKQNLIRVFRQIQIRIKQFQSQLKISNFYQMINKFSILIENIAKQIQVGNFILCFQEIIKCIVEEIEETKNQLIIQTPKRFVILCDQVERKMKVYHEQILLSCWTLNQFIKSYKKSVELKRQAHYLQTQSLEQVHNLLLMINITSSKQYQNYYIKFLQLRDLFKKIQIKRIKFQQSISKKLKFLQPEKILLIRKIQKQLDLIIKKLFSATEKPKLNVQKCNEEIQQLYHLVSEYEEIINDLDLVKNLEIIHCLKTQEETHFHSFAKTKNQINYIIKLLKSYKDFSKSFQEQINCDFRYFRTEFFLDLLQRERIKIKHGNRVLYQFQTFIINCYALYNQFKSTIQLIGLLKRLENHELQSIGFNKQFFNFTQNPVYTGNTIKYLTFSQAQQQYIQVILRKKQFNHNFIKTLNQIEKQIGKIRFQTKYDEKLKQNLFVKLDQKINLIFTFSSKISSLKDTKWLTSSNNQGYQIVNKIQAIYNFLTELNERQSDFIQLQRFKSNCSIEEISINFRKIGLNQNLFLSTTEHNKNLWEDLISLINNCYLDNIVSHFLDKVKDILNALKISIQKQILLFKNLINKKKQQYPILYLFQDHIILSILTSTQNFFIYFYSFVENASFQIKRNTLYFEITTIYGQNLIIQLKKVNRNQSQNNMEGNAMKGLQEQIKYVDEQKILEQKISEQKSRLQLLNLLSNQFNLGKISKLIKKQIQNNFTLCRYKYKKQKLMKIPFTDELKPPLSVVYICDQLYLLQFVKQQSIVLSQDSNCTKIEFAESITKQILKQINEITSEYVEYYTDLAIYQKNLTTLLILSKIQFRDKFSYVVEENGWSLQQYHLIMENFLSFSIDQEDKSQVALNCYHQTLHLSFQLVDYCNISAVQPINQKVYIQLFKTLTNYKCGILQNSMNLQNLLTKLLKTSYFTSMSQNQIVQNLIEIGKKKDIVFIIDINSSFMNSSNQFLQTCAFIFNQINQIKMHIHAQKQKEAKQMNQQVVSVERKLLTQHQSYCPTIFIESKLFHNKLTLNQIQFSSISMIQSMRLIQFYQPSFVFYLELAYTKFHIQLPHQLKFYIIQKFKLFQLKLERQKSYSTTRRDIESVLQNLFQLYKLYNELDQDMIQKYFLSYYEQQQEASPYDLVLVKTQKPNQKKQRRTIKKKKMFKQQKSNYAQLIQLFNSINKSLKLVQYYKQFHNYLQKDQQNILLFGKSFTGKTTFYKKYFNCMNKYLVSQRSLVQITNYHFIEINLFITQFSSAVQFYDYLKVKAQKEQNSDNNSKSIIILKDIDEKSYEKLQKIIVYRKLTLQFNLPLSLSGFHIIVEVKSLSNLPPNVIFQFKKLYFTEKTVQWTQLLIERSKYITEKLFNIEKHRQSKKRQQQHVLKSLSKIPYVEEQQQKIKKSHPLQIFCIALSDFFQQIDFKKFFVIDITEKYLISSTFTLFKSIFVLFQKQIFETYFSLQLINFSRQTFIRKLFLYSFYWTSYWLIEKSFLKKYDTILRDILSRNDISLRDVKFMHILLFRKHSYQMVHIKYFDQIINKSNNISVAQASGLTKNQLKYQRSPVDSCNNQIYIQSYQTKLYKYFIQTLACSQSSIVVFGKEKIGKSSLIKHYLKLETKNYLILNIIDPIKCYQKIIGKILKMKQQSQTNKVTQQIRNKFFQQATSAKNILSNKKIEEDLKSSSKTSIKSRKNIKASLKKIQFQVMQRQNKCQHSRIKHIFLEDVSMKNIESDFLIDFLRENKKIPLNIKNYSSQFNAKSQFNSQNCQQDNLKAFEEILFIKLESSTIIRKLSFLEMKNKVKQKYQHYYPLHMFFQSQEYWEGIIGSYFQNTIKAGFVDSQQINQLIKNRSPIIKSFMKLYENLLNFFSLQNQNQSNLSILRKHNRLSIFNIEDLLVLFRSLNAENIKSRKDLIQSIRFSIKINLHYKITNPIDQNKFQSIANRFFMTLVQSFNVKSLLSSTYYDDVQQKGISGIQNEVKKDSYADQEHIFKKKQQPIQSKRSQHQYEQILMKKIQYQNKHKKFRLNKNIIQSLNKIKEAIQNSNKFIIVLNKIGSQQIQSFAQFSFQWFQFKQVVKIRKPEQLIEFFVQRQKNHNILKETEPKNDMQYNSEITQFSQNFSQRSSVYQNSSKSRHFNELTKGKQFLLEKNNQKVILFIAFQIFQLWSKNIQFLYYYLFEQGFFNKLVGKQRKIKVIIEYQELQQRTIKHLQMNKKYLLSNSTILHLNISSENQINAQNICKLMIKNQKFNGDYQKSMQISKIILSLYPNLEKIMINNQLPFQMRKYLFSQQNFDRFIVTFIDVYYFYQIQLKTFINLINSGVGDINSLIEEYAHKKVVHKELKAEMHIHKIKCQSLNQRKGKLEDQIQDFFNSESYSKKKQFVKQIEKKKEQIKGLNQKKQHLKHKSNYYSNFLTRNELAELKYLFLNSYQHNKELFEAISLIVADQYSEASIKRVILDINLLSKLKEINFRLKPQKLLNEISEKLNVFYKQKQDKANSMNMFLWIYYTNQYYHSKFIHKRKIQKIQLEISQMGFQIIHIESEARISYKQSQIESLLQPINQHTQKINQLIKSIQQIEPFFKLESKIQNITHFSDISKSIKTSFEKQYNLLVVQAFYISLWICFLSCLGQQQKFKEDSMLSNISKGVIELIYKKITIQNFNNKDELHQFLKIKPQIFFYLYEQDLKRIALDQQSIKLKNQSTVEIDRVLRSKMNQIKEAKYKSSKSRDSSNHNSKQTQINLFISSQLRRKILLIQFLVKKKYGSQIIIIDSQNLLLSTFSLACTTQVYFFFKKSNSKNTYEISKNLKYEQANQNQKHIVGYLYDMQSSAYFESEFAIIFIFIPNNQWNFSYQISGSKLQKIIALKIDHISYETRIQMLGSKQIKILFVKNKLQNYLQKSSQFHLIDFAGSLQNHENQILQFNFIKQPLSFDEINQISQIKQQDQSQNQNQTQTQSCSQLAKQVLKHEGYKKMVEDYFNENIWTLQRKNFHISMLNSNHKFLCNSKKKLSIHQKEHLFEVDSKIENWKQVYEEYRNFQNGFNSYKKFSNNLHMPLIRRILDIYRMTIKVGDCFHTSYRQNSLLKSLDGINIHSSSLFYQILQYLEEATNYLKQSKQSLFVEGIQKRMAYQNQIIQNFILYRLASQDNGIYVIILAYMRIYSFQNKQTSTIDLKNIFHQTTLSSQISGYLNSKIGYHYIQNLKQLPGNKFQLQTFMRRFIKELKSTNLNFRFQDKEMVKQFIQKFEYETRIISKDKDHLNNKNQKEFSQKFKLSKLSIFSELLLKKILLPEEFYNEIYFTSIQSILFKAKTLLWKLQQPNQNTQVIENIHYFQQYIRNSKVWIYFCDLPYWYNFILENYSFKYQNSSKTILISIRKNSDLILDFIKIQQQNRKQQQGQALHLIFDFRYEKDNANKTIKSNRLHGKIEQKKMIYKISEQYLKLKRKNVIIFANQKFHKEFHQTQKIIHLNSPYKKTIHHLSTLQENNYGNQIISSEFNNHICCSSKQLVERLLENIFQIDFFSIFQKMLKSQLLSNQSEENHSKNQITQDNKFLNEKRTKKIYTVGSIIQNKNSLLQQNLNQFDLRQKNELNYTNAVYQIICLNQNFGYQYEVQIMFKTFNLLKQIGKYHRQILHLKKQKQIQQQKLYTIKQIQNLDTKFLEIENKKQINSRREVEITDHSQESQQIGSKTVYEDNLEQKKLKEQQKQKYNILSLSKYLQKHYFYSNNQSNFSTQSILKVNQKAIIQKYQEVLFSKYRSNDQIKFSNKFQINKIGKLTALKQSGSLQKEQAKNQIYEENRPNFLKYPNKIYLLFQHKENSRLEQISQVTSLIFKSKLKIFTLLQQNYASRFQSNLQEPSSSLSKFVSNQSVLSSNKVEDRIEQKNETQTKKRRNSIEQNQNFGEQNKNAINYKKRNQQVKSKQRKQQVNKIQFQISLNPHLINNPLINRRKHPRHLSIYRQSIQMSENQKSQIQKIITNNDKILINTGEKFKGITSSEFYNKKQARIINALLETYQKLKQYALIKTNNIDLKQENLFIQNQYRTNNIQFINASLNQNQFQIRNSKQKSENHSNNNKNSSQIFQKIFLLPQQMIDLQILKYCTKFSKLLEAFHKVKIILWKEQDSKVIQLNPYLKILQGFPSDPKKLLIIQNQSITHAKSFQFMDIFWFSKPLLQVQLLSQFLNLKRNSSIFYDKNHLLRLKCNTIKNLKYVQREEKQQISVQDQKCSFCHPFHKGGDKIKLYRKCSSSNTMQSYPLLNIQIQNKLYEIHIIPNLSNRTQNLVRSDSQRIESPLANSRKFKQANQSKQKNILIIKKGNIQFPVLIECKKCLREIYGQFN